MQRGIRPLHQPIMQPDESRQTSAVCAILNKLGLTREEEEPQVPPDQKQEGAPASAVNAIMGKLGLAKEASEPEADETELARGLTDPAWAVRVATVQKLGNIGEHAHLELLLVALRDEYASVRIAAARALSRNPRQAALPALVASLTDTDWVVRTEVVRALGKLADPEALDALLVTVHDTDTAVRAAALLALSDMGATEARAILNAALQDEDWSVREAATLALAQLSPSTVIPFSPNAHLDKVTQTEPLKNIAFTEPLKNAASTEPLKNVLYTEQNADREERAFFPAKYAKDIPVIDNTHYWSRTRPNRSMSLSPDITYEFTCMRLVQKLVILFIFTGLIGAWFILANRPNVSAVRPNTPTTFTIYNDHDSSVEKLAWSPDGLTMASVDSLGTIRLWQVSNGHTIAKYTQAGNILALNWSDENTLLVAYGIANNSLQVLQLNMGTTLSVRTIFRRFGLPSTPTVAAWSSDGSILAFDTGQNASQDVIQPWIVNATTHKNLPMIPIPLSQPIEMSSRSPFNQPTGTFDNSPLSQLVWSPDDSQLATISQHGQLRIWNVSTGTMLTTLPNEQQITSVAWISCKQSGDYGLAFAQAQNALLEWCPGQRILSFPLAQAYNVTDHSQLSVKTIAVSPQSTQILLATSDGFVQVRNATNGRLLYVYTGHHAPVNAIIWSPNERSIATASMDTTVQIWQEM